MLYILLNTGFFFLKYLLISSCGIPVGMDETAIDS